LIQVTNLPSIIALIICIVGGIKSTSSDSSDQTQGKTMLKAGIIIFLIIYLILCVLASYTAMEFSKIPSGEKRILAAVLVTLPFVLPRLLWSLLAYFSHITTFNVVEGSIVVRSVMSTLEEFLVIIMYTVVGLLVPPAYKKLPDAGLGRQSKSGAQDIEFKAQQPPKYEVHNSFRT